MVRKRKNPWKLFLLVFILCSYTGYLVSGIFLIKELSISNLEKTLTDIFTHPLQNYWNDKSLPCIMTGFCIWLCFISYYLYNYRNFLPGKEDGSAQWEDLKRIKKRLENPVLEKNFILSKHIKVSKNILSNNNILIIGSPGTGKSLFEVTPNLLLCAASYVVLDVKGELLRKYGNFLKERGYQLKVLNLKEMLCSNQYNPFRYITKEEDVVRLVSNIQVNTTPPDAMKGEPFWEDGCALYLQSLFFYVWLEIPSYRRNMNRVLELVNMENHVVDDEGNTELTLAMERLAAGTMGKQHPAYRDYMKLKKGAPDTVSSIIIMVNAKLKYFETKPLCRIFEDDEMDLKEIGIGKNGDGKTKTALFLVTPDNDTSFNFVMGMLYTQLFDTLIRTADMECGGTLPLPVEIWMDEFANGARPEKFEQLITTLRSRNIAAIPILQSVSQIKTIYKNDAWDIIMDACSMFVFLGAGRGAVSTQKYVSELLGKATIDKKSEGESRGSHGNSSRNFDHQGRELLTPAEVGALDNKKCILFLQGYQPILDEKYIPFEDDNYKEAIGLGIYEHNIVVKKGSSGAYRTVKPKGCLELLDDASITYYRERQKQGEPIRFLELDWESFLELDLTESFHDSVIDYEVVSNEL